MVLRRAPIAALAAALLLLLALGAQARASPSWQRALRIKSGDSPNNLRALEWLTRRGREREDEPAYLAIKYIVPPGMHEKFVEEWDRLEKSLQDARGLDFYQLSKVNHDNLHFWAYTEWDTFRDLMDHCGSREFEDFNNFIDNNDIMVEAFPLEAVGDRKREYRADREGTKAAAAARAAATKDLERRRRRGGGGLEDWDPREMPAHLAVKFHVPPSMREDFLDAFTSIQDKVVDDEENNRFYVLRKYATMNHHYVLRGGWDDLESYLDHITSKHFRRLREYAADNDIEWYYETFRPLFSSEGVEEGMLSRKA